MRKLARPFGLAAASLTLLLAACGPTTEPAATPTNTSPTQQPTAEVTAAPTDPTETAALATATSAEPISSPTTAVSDVTPTTASVGTTPTAGPTVDLSALTWQQVGLGGNSVTDLAVAGGQTLDLVMAAGPQGAWTSRYGYTDWQKRGVTPAGEARTGEAEVGSAEVLYYSSHTGCASGLPNNSWRSTDGGATWTQMQSEGLSIAASGPTIAYATSCNGLLKTTDSGATWTELGTPQLSSDPISLAASPDGETVYAGYASEGGTGQLWVSRNGGATWTEATPKELGGLDSFRAPSHMIYAPGSVGRPDDGGLYVANDQGIWYQPLESQEWEFNKKPEVEGGEPDNYYWHSAFLVDTTYGTQVEKSGPAIYVARAKPGADGNPVSLGVWRSGDNGATWQPIGKGLENTYVTALNLAITDSTGTGRGMGVGLFETLLAGTDDGVWALQR
jgi:hypothetical protein